MNEKATHERKKEKASTRSSKTVKAKGNTGDRQQHTNGAGHKPQTLNGDLRQLPTALAPFIKLPNWVLWRWQLNNKGKWTKVPYQRGGAYAKSTDPATWTSYTTLLDSLPQFDGIGFCLYGTDFAAFDIDDCRDPTTGAVDPWAVDLVAQVGSYAEITPSGTGLRIIGHGKGAEIHRGKRRISDTTITTVEVYRRTSRYITVTGNPYRDCDLINIDAVMEAVDAELESAKKKQQRASKDDAGGRQTTDIPQELRSKLYHKDAAAYVSRSELFFSFITGCLRKGIADEAIIAACLNEEFAGCAIYEHCQDNKGHDYVVEQIAHARAKDFERDAKGHIIAKNQNNIRRALNLLGVRLSYDAFHDRLLATGLAGFDVLDDAAAERLYLLINEEFNFLPPIEFFLIVLRDTARYNTFHPVCDYLNSLQWDGTPRLDNWLATYGGADSRPYTRAVGALLLIAAVRRVRSPGCKFDEMGVLESSEQGTNKSSALAILAYQQDWFSDDLPLNVESKRIIEALRGRWIVEAGELAGMKKTDVEHLKTMLSRQVDRARMAYGRMVMEAPRQCIIVGTTNLAKYLRDQTGNRRFWPVTIKAFDLDTLKRDRDQLWAEAVMREARGDSIRLDRSLWKEAAIEQQERTVKEPWIDLLSLALGKAEGKLLVEDAWTIVGVAPGLRTQEHNARLGFAMRALNWEHKQLRLEGEHKWWYVRNSDKDHQKPRRIYVARPKPNELEVFFISDQRNLTGAPVREYIFQSAY